MEDVFEPTYSPRKIWFWLEHWEELDCLVESPRSSNHIAEHLNREWFLLQVRLRTCLCKEIHDAEMLAVDHSCTHMPSGGTAYKVGVTTAVCIAADLRQAAEALPPWWSASHQIWKEQMVPRKRILSWVDTWRRERITPSREPIFARDVAIRRMALSLGWRPARAA